MSFRTGFYVGLIVAVIWGIYLVRLWQGQRQVELHSVRLLAQIEKHNWKAVDEFVGSDYVDQWGNDRALLLERLRDVFRALPNARVESKVVSVQTRNGRGSWIARITLKSTGEFADLIQNRVNSLDSPFEFEWQRGATWPWDWKLVAVKNPALEIPNL
ncbi:MAG: hypothetical protein DME97_11125 [Verrucomicrobia bacterium]|nr:MAG: hypothetical protein DME97_11125 [Verrucomicrobiota bacterium]